MKANPKAIHIAKSHKTNHTSQNLAISMPLPTQKEMLTKFEIMNKMIKHESTTLYISNGGQSAINERYMYKLNTGANMKISGIKSATAHILVRCVSYWKKKKIESMAIFEINDKKVNRIKPHWPPVIIGPNFVEKI